MVNTRRPGGDAASAEEQPNLFISYAREELTFVRRLRELLHPSGLRAWTDVGELHAGEEFWPEICRAIDAAPAFVFVITPESVASPFCRRELARAVAGRKRLVPVCRRELPDDPGLPEIAGLQWVFLRDGDDEADGIRALTSAVHADWIWLRQHARLLVRAEEWASSRGDRSLVLRGRELREADAWLGRVPDGPERPTAVQREFVGASHTARRRRIAVTSVATAMASIAIAIFSWRAMVARLDTANNQAARALTTGTAEGASRALQLLASPAATCRRLPMRLEACQLLWTNLGVAQRSDQRFADSIDSFTRVVDDIDGETMREDEALRLAGALWRRSVSRIRLAEEPRGDRERERLYALADADLSRASAIYDRYPAHAALLPIPVTRARLLIAKGDYQRAQSALDAFLVANTEKILLQAIVQICLGRRFEGLETFRNYNAAVPDKSTGPEFKNNLPFFERMVARCSNAPGSQLH